MISKILGSRLLNTLKITFVLCALAFFVYFGFESAELYKQLLAGIEWQWLVLVILTLMTQSILGGVFTFTLVSPISNTLGFGDVLKVHISRLPTRYLPGGIWHVSSKLYDFHSKGVTAQGITQIAVFETLMPIVVTFLLGGVAVYSWHQAPGFWSNLALIAALFSFSFVAGYCWLTYFKFFEKYLLPKRSFYQAFFVVSVYWILAGLGFCFYLASLYDELRGMEMLEAWGVYLFSWGVGNLAIFSPQGVGVLEWVASSMLSAASGIGSMMLIVAGYRVMILISDALCYSIYCVVSVIGVLRVNRSNN